MNVHTGIAIGTSVPTFVMFFPDATKLDGYFVFVSPVFCVNLF